MQFVVTLISGLPLSYTFAPCAVSSWLSRAVSRKNASPHILQLRELIWNGTPFLSLVRRTRFSVTATELWLSPLQNGTSCRAHLTHGGPPLDSVLVIHMSKIFCLRGKHSFQSVKSCTLMLTVHGLSLKKKKRLYCSICYNGPSLVAAGSLTLLSFTSGSWIRLLGNASSLRLALNLRYLLEF